MVHVPMANRYFSSVSVKRSEAQFRDLAKEDSVKLESVGSSMYVTQGKDKNEIAMLVKEYEEDPAGSSVVDQESGKTFGHHSDTTSSSAAPESCATSCANCFTNAFCSKAQVIPDKYNEQIWEFTSNRVRCWTLGMNIAYFLSSFSFSQFDMKNTPIQFLMGHGLYLVIFVLLIASFCTKNYTPATVAAYLFEIRIGFNLLAPVDFTDERKKITGMAQLTGNNIMLFFNLYLINKINPWRKEIQNLIVFILACVANMIKIVGYDKLLDDAGIIIIYIIPIIIFLPMFQALTNSINNYSDEFVSKA